MNPGDAVEVLTIWAGGPPEIQRKAWIGGYTFVRAEGDVTILRHEEGLYAGCAVRHWHRHVRPAQKKASPQ